MLKSILKAIYRKSRRIFPPHPFPDLKEYISKNDAIMLKKMPAIKPATITFFDKQISFPSAFWFLHSIREIFIEEVYKFYSTDEEPIIIDCGANIGLSILYFKQLFPNAKVIAFEPDKMIFKNLQDNLSKFDYKDIELYPKGVWMEETKLSFLGEGTLGGRVFDVSVEQSFGYDTIEIETVRLRDFLHRQIDFLKVDIEGAEYEVLNDCSDLLVNVKLLFVEYHSKPNYSQKLDDLLSILSKAGFRYYIKEASHDIKYPFIEKKSDWFDLQLNIFCYRINDSKTDNGRELS